MMIDYFAHLASLTRATEGLAAINPADTLVKTASDALLKDVASETSSATLGALVDHIVAHAASDGAELQLLTDVSAVWTQGIGLYNRFGAARGQMEGALAAPSAADSLAHFNAAQQDLNQIRDATAALMPQVQALQQRALKGDWLPAHPRQRDTAIKSWDWGNLFIARRTDAFVRALFAKATTSAERAFAFGALSSYGANVAGSAFLGQVVGGPRRTHRFRDRLARNTAGVWMAQHLPLATLSGIADMLNNVGPLGPIGMPAALKSIFQAALRETFERDDLPDVSVGVSRTVQHLRLLDGIKRPAPPTAPPASLATGSGDTPAVLQTLDDTLGDPGAGGIGVGGSTGSSTGVTGADTQSSSGSLCGFIIGLIAAALLVLLINCLVTLAEDGKCKPFKVNGEATPPQDDATDVTAEQLTTMATGAAGPNIVQTMYGIQATMWQAFDAAYSFLAVSGLIYPDGLLMGSPVYKQFVSIPTNVGWPLRAATNPYVFYPSSTIEHPDGRPSVYSPGNTPSAFLFGAAGNGSPDVWAHAQLVWMQIVRHELDAENHDMDADRGFAHPCWNVADGTSIQDDPVNVVILAYKAI